MPPLKCTYGRYLGKAEAEGFLLEEATTTERAAAVHTKLAAEDAAVLEPRRKQ